MKRNVNSACVLTAPTEMRFRLDSFGVKEAEIKDY